VYAFGSTGREPTAQGRRQPVWILLVPYPGHSFTRMSPRGRAPGLMWTIAISRGFRTTERKRGSRPSGRTPGDQAAGAQLSQVRVAYDQVRAVTRSAGPGTGIGCVQCPVRGGGGHTIRTKASPALHSG
jgi:hypothetical protein